MKKEKETIEINTRWIEGLRNYIEIVRKNSGDDLGLKIAIGSLLGYLDGLIQYYDQNPKKTIKQLIDERVEKFRKKWERDFSEPSRGNPDQWITRSPLNYEDFLRQSLLIAAENLEEPFKKQIEEIEEWIEKKAHMALIHPDFEWKEFRKKLKQFLGDIMTKNH